jgi:hypothetical protein
MTSADLNGTCTWLRDRRAYNLSHLNGLDTGSDRVEVIESIASREQREPMQG